MTSSIPSAEASPPPASPPAYSLFSPNQILLAALLGSPVLGGVLLFLNYRRLGRAELATQAMLVTAGATAALVGLAFLIPGRSMGILPLVTAIGLWQYAKREEDTFEAHLAAGGSKASIWTVAGIGLGGSVLLIALVLPLAIVLEPRVEFGGEQVVYYEDDATEADARKLGAYFQESGVFDGQSAMDVQLSKKRGIYEISFILADGAWDDPEVIKDFEIVRQESAARAFSGNQVVVHLCNSYSITKRTVR